MKPWQFYTLTVIGICLIALTGAISYSLYNLSTQIADVTRYLKQVAKKKSASVQSNTNTDSAHYTKRIFTTEKKNL